MQELMAGILSVICLMEKIIDIPVDKATNLPLIINFVCYTEDKFEFGPTHLMDISSSKGAENPVKNHGLFDNYE